MVAEKMASNQDLDPQVYPTYRLDVSTRSFRYINRNEFGPCPVILIEQIL